MLNVNKELKDLEVELQKRKKRNQELMSNIEKQQQ